MNVLAMRCINASSLRIHAVRDPGLVLCCRSFKACCFSTKFCWRRKKASGSGGSCRCEDFANPIRRRMLSALNGVLAQGVIVGVLLCKITASLFPALVLPHVTLRDCIDEFAFLEDSGQTPSKINLGNLGAPKCSLSPSEAPNRLLNRHDHAVEEEERSS